MTELVLVPTQREFDRIRPRLVQKAQNHDCSFQLCGFGPIAAAARTGALLARYKPERVMLIGIAGSYVDHLELGSAYRFDSVACDGVGVSAGKNFQTAGQMGWHHFSGDDIEPKVGDVIRLDAAYIDGIPSAGLLISCCAASASQLEASWRLDRYREAVAEDMEGFGVALACSLARVPVQIVRGISNRAGDRDLDGWQINQALDAAADFAVDVLARKWIPVP
jgi:futalosine hydrolase